MSSRMVERRKEDRHFIEQLLDTSKLDSYVVPVSIKADLRKYQQVIVMIVMMMMMMMYYHCHPMMIRCLGWYQLVGFPQQVQASWNPL